MSRISIPLATSETSGDAPLDEAREDIVHPHTTSMDLRAWSDYMAENRRANVAYAENPLAFSDQCDANDRRRFSNQLYAAWKLQVQR
jgi:hypothetical protein